MRLNRQCRSSCFRNSVRASADSLSRKNGGEQWSCPTGLAARNGFQPITALCGFTLRKNGGGERSCSPAARSRPSRFKRVPAPCPVSPPKVPAAGFAPASIRLEGGGLSFSATGSGPHGGTPTRNTAFEAPHDCNFTTRGKMVPSRGLAPRSRASRARILLLDDEEKSGARRRSRTGLVRLTRSARRSLRLTGIGRRAG